LLVFPLVDLSSAGLAMALEFLLSSLVSLLAVLVFSFLLTGFLTVVGFLSSSESEESSFLPAFPLLDFSPAVLSLTSAFLPSVLDSFLIVLVFSFLSSAFLSSSESEESSFLSDFPLLDLSSTVLALTSEFLPSALAYLLTVLVFLSSAFLSSSESEESSFLPDFPLLDLSLVVLALTTAFKPSVLASLLSVLVLVFSFLSSDFLSSSESEESSFFFASLAGALAKALSFLVFSFRSEAFAF
jgi:hypothetical protein